MEINLFRLCSGLKVIGYFMILLVAAIISVSYYAIVVVTWGPELLRGGVHSFLAFFIIVMFHILLVMLLWSYFMVVFKDPGSVPENWKPLIEEENLEAGSSLTLSENIEPEAFTSTQSSDGRERRPQVGYCSRCQNGKPPRCHHCSVLLNLAFALSLLCFVVMHASLLSSNTTTVEVHEKRGAIRWKYDLGRKKNFEQVFGTKKALWLLPLFSKEDLDNVPALRGLEFPTLSDTEA